MWTTAETDSLSGQKETKLFNVIKLDYHKKWNQDNNWIMLIFT